MLKNENIICISSIDWDFIWQGHQEIMSTFAREGNRVLFIENTGARAAGTRDLSRLKKRFVWRKKSLSGIRQIDKDIYVFSPVVFPFPYSRVFRFFNKHILLSMLRKWIKSMEFRDVIFWVYLPTPISLDMLNSIEHKLTVYCCIDNLSLSSPGAKKIKKYEAEVIRKSDLVFVTGKNLHNHCRQYRDKNICIFREGVNIDVFEKINNEQTLPPQDLNGIPRPIIGYVGGIHKWLDQELIKYAAQRHPECSFVFVGPLQNDISVLNNLKNIYFLGQKNGIEIPLYIKEFEICLIPYLIKDYTRNVYPTKLNEYLAMGKPVISTDMPEIEFFNQEYNNIVEIASSKDEFSQLINKLLKEGCSYQKDTARLAVARDNSWSARIEAMSKKMQEIMEL